MPEELKPIYLYVHTCLMMKNVKEIYLGSHSIENCGDYFRHDNLKAEPTSI